MKSSVAQRATITPEQSTRRGRLSKRSAAEPVVPELREQKPISMNRIQAFSSVLEPEFSLVRHPRGQAGVSAVFASVRGDGPCAFFAPLHYEANYAYPLLVWLHGAGDDESQLKRIMPLVSIRNYVGVSLRGPLRVEKQDGRPGLCLVADGVATWHWPNSGCSRPSSWHGGAITLPPTACFWPVSIAAARWPFGWHEPSRPAFAECCRFAAAFPPAAGRCVRLAEARRLPLFLACGRDSKQYTTSHVCDDLKLFHSAGMHIALRQYPCGHQIHRSCWRTWTAGSWSRSPLPRQTRIDT